MTKYAVIFKTKRDLPIPDEYLSLNKRMAELVSNYGGYLGVDGAGKSRFSEELFKVISNNTERLILLSSTDSFHNPRDHRFVQGKPLYESFYENSFNYSVLKDKLLDPLKHGTKDYCFLSHFDHQKNLETNSNPVLFNNNSILIFEGIFSHRTELIDYWDFSIFLDCDFEESYKRMSLRDGGSSNPKDKSNERYYKGQLLYFDLEKPRDKANLVINNTDFLKPEFV